MAKEFMAKAEEMKAAPYFTAYEEEIVLFHEDTLLEGDIRAWLKKREGEKALNDWKAQPVAGKLIRKFPKQVLILAKEIWKSAIHCMDGVAWIYFIFAICHRLPTNLQKHKFLKPLSMWSHRRRGTSLRLSCTRNNTQDNLRRPWIMC